MKNNNANIEMRLAVLIGMSVCVLFGCGGLQPMLSDSWPISSCGDIDVVSDAKYCFYQTGPQPQYTIWFFHGAGDSEKVFQQSFFPQGSYIELEKGLPSVNIVTISYGPLWIMTAYDHRTLNPANATVDVFASKIVPFIEKKFYDFVVRPYVAMGHSQGGINVATLCAVLADDMWSKCVLLNPMLPSCDPYNWPTCRASWPGLLIRENYSAKGWEETQPLIMLQIAKNKGRKVPKSFVTACSSDMFGSFYGPNVWSQQATQLGFVSKWDPVLTKCDHYHWPAQDVLQFLGSP